MRNDTTFTDEKLSTEEFSQKYWLGGVASYQYHTASIEDGRDEREQFVFNNIRALKETIDFHTNYTQTKMETLQRKIKRITTFTAIGGFILLTGLILILLA